MLSPLHTALLQRLYEGLEHTEVTWAITGSVSFALQGLAIASHDIDIQTDAHGAYAIEHCFSSYVTQPVAFSAAEKIRSHFCYT